MMDVRLMKSGTLALMPVAILTAAPAHAKLPEPVRAMIDAAIATGDAAKVTIVLDLAKATNPDDAGEIDAIGAEFNAEQQAVKLAEAEAREEAIRTAGLTENWSGEGQIGASRATGNSSNIGLTGGLELTRNGIDWRHKVLARANFQQTNGITTREQYLFSYEPNYEVNDRLFSYALGQYENDRFQGYTSRISLSGGLGYRIIETVPVKFSVKAGPAYRETEFVDGRNEMNITGLAALDLDWKLADRVKLTQDASAFVRSGNSTYLSATGVESRIMGSLSARIAYVVEHNTSPPINAVRTDTLSRVTLIYGF